MMPPRNFPPGVLKLAEFEGTNLVRTVTEMPTTTRNRLRIQQMRNDMLMVNPKLNLQIIENNAYQ